MPSEPVSGDSDGPASETATVRIFASRSAAEATAASLEARGIRCWITADDCGGMLPNLTGPGGVKLLVSATDADAARALLNSQALASEPPLSLDADLQPAVSQPARHKTFSPGTLAIGIIVGVLLCLLYQRVNKWGTKTYRYDTNGDGKPDEVWVYRNGQYVESSYDRNFDGKPDSWNFFDANSRNTLSKADDNFDGIADVTWEYSNGVLASSRRDTDFNGTPDATSTFLHEMATQSDWQPNGTNVVTLRQFFRHDVLTEEWRDLNGDGTFDRVVQYDAFQNPIATNLFKLLSPQSK